MKEIVIFGSYTDTKEKEKTLIDNIKNWKTYNIPIILSTHYPVNISIQNMVDYYVFDKNQYMDWRLVNKRHYYLENLKVEMFYDRPYHAAAGLISISNAIKLIGNKYDMFYFLDYDVILNIKDLLDFIRSKEKSPYNIFLFKWPNFENAYMTNTQIFRNNEFQKIWGKMESVDDYLYQVNLTEEKNTLIEPLVNKLINTKGLNQETYVFNEEEKSNFLLDNTKHSAKSGTLKTKSYLASTTTGSAILFLINEENKSVKFKITEEFLQNGYIQNHKGILTENSNGFSLVWRLFQNNTKLTIELDDNIKEYIISDGIEHSECYFEFYNGNYICKNYISKEGEKNEFEY